MRSQPVKRAAGLVFWEAGLKSRTDGMGDYRAHVSASGKEPLHRYGPRRDLQTTGSLVAELSTHSSSFEAAQRKFFGFVYEVHNLILSPR
jgi:hypothetical protein